MSGSDMVVLKRRLCGKSLPGRRFSWNAGLLPLHIKGRTARHPTSENRGPEATQPWSPTLIPSGVVGRGDLPKRWALHTAELHNPQFRPLDSACPHILLECLYNAKKLACRMKDRGFLLQGTVDGTHKFRFAHCERQCLVELTLV